VTDLHAADQIPGDKGLGRAKRQLLVEVECKELIDPAPRDHAPLLAPRTQSGRRGDPTVRESAREKVLGVRPEAQQSSEYPALARTLNDGAQKRLMSEVDTVEVADGEHTR
jgi:hypothetical protein